MKGVKSIHILSMLWEVISLQTGIFDWLAQNVFFSVALLSVLFIVLLAIYIKLFVRIVYEGITYRHFRKGRLLKESNSGGMVVLIPFLDRIEIFPPCEPALLDSTDFTDEKEFE
jgi:hypothetical protein